jgi:endogenous inhibitor of DNA gyrase (YacG/DUF329 family)
VTWEKNNYRPFCSLRCSQIDLGNWASEIYTLSTPINFEALTEENDQTPVNPDSQAV